MTTRNEFAEGLARHSRMVGVWTMSGSAVAAEALANAGYDFVVLDMEHAPNDPPVILGLLQTVAGTPASAIVRLPWNDAVVVKQVLDFGAQTVMFPYIQNADEAARAVASTRYPPNGLRGFAGMSRATRYGSLTPAAAAAEIRTIVQLETVSALSRIENIAAVPGVDSIFVGPGDLSADMGYLGQPGHPDVQAAIVEAAKICQGLRIPTGILAPNAAQAAIYFDMGFTWVAAGSDLNLMMSSARADVAALRERLST